MHKLIALLLVMPLLALSACQMIAPVADAPVSADGALSTTESASGNGDAAEVDLSGVKEFALQQAGALARQTADVQAGSQAYYDLAAASDFDYAALWANDAETVKTMLQVARDAWMVAAPAYEKMEGVVAGTPSLAEYDVILDAGASGAEDPEGAVPFDLTLPDGRVLAKPGNLFGVTESALWGTEPEYDSGVAADWNADGTVEFAENLPDANVLKAAADALKSYSDELEASIQAWEPTLSDAFTALVVMVPTMSEYFGSWRDSRFVLGDASEQRDFVVISRLSDIIDIVGGLELVYEQVKPLAATADADQSDQIASGLTSLREFVAGVYAEEQGGRTFTPEEADTLGAEAQDRATAITGQISQIAAQLGIEIAE